MSKIGKKPIAVPSGVDVSFTDHTLTVKGSKGTVTRVVPVFLDVTIQDGKVFVAPAEGGTHGELAARWGLERALIRNMIVGVSKGFQEALELQGVGYKAMVKGGGLELNLGLSHPVVVPTPEGITFTVEKNIVTVSGSDHEVVGRTAASIRSLRPPEPYKGSGIRYVGEVIKLKAGKKAVATAA